MFNKMLKKIAKVFFNNTLKKINKFKGIHKNETCYIIGTGASLKEFDLKLFNDKPVIGINEILFHKDFINLNNKYLVFSEPFFFYPFFNKFIWKQNFLPLFTPTSFFFKSIAKKNQNITFFIHISNILFFRGKNIFYNFLKYPHTDFPSKLNNINCFAGGFTHALSLAVFLGFKKAILIGNDYTFSPPQGKHFYEKGKGVNVEIENYHPKFLETIQNFIELETITIEKNDTYLKSVEYKEYKKTNNNYKENFELIDEEFFTALKNTRKGVYDF
jgi:hypothetical protein